MCTHMTSFPITTFGSFLKGRILTPCNTPPPFPTGSAPDEGLVINYREGRATKFVTPPPQNRVKLVPSPPFKEWKLFVPSPPSIWLKLQATPSKLPQNFLRTPPPPPFRMAKTCSAPPPPLVGVKLHMPPSCFVAPLPVLSDQSLRTGNIGPPLPPPPPLHQALG